MIKRLHDFGFSAFLSLFVFLPGIINVIMVVLILPNSQQTENKYGHPYKEEKSFFEDNKFLIYVSIPVFLALSIYSYINIVSQTGKAKRAVIEHLSPTLSVNEYDIVGTKVNLNNDIEVAVRLKSNKMTGYYTISGSSFEVIEVKH